MAEKKDEDGLNILIGLILIVFVALALIWAFSGINSCPENTFSCEGSPCGCCIADANNNSVASCGLGICPEGTYFFEGMGCCPSTDPVSCLKPYNYCKTIIPCGDSFCCGTDSCVIQTDGSSKCIPCSVNSVCDPLNVNSCCDGFACGSDGFCKKIDSCVGLKCSNYNQPCSICDGSDNCVSCEDNSLCLYSEILGYGTCTSMCDSTHPACPYCPSGCCNSDGSCASCLNNACTVAGQPCALSSTIPCAEICANVGGSLSCQSIGGCPSGYVTCDNPSCPGGCCSVLDGSCASCLGNSCSIEEEGQLCSLCDTSGSCTSCSDSICHNSLCVSKDSIVNCPTGYVLYEQKCVKQSPTGPVIDEDPETPECPTGYILNNNICINPNDSTDPLPPNENEEDEDDDDVSDWLLDLKTSCIEECEDCKTLECDYSDMNIYDLNGDTDLNVKDLEIFTNYYKTILPSIEVNYDNKKFDFNHDNIIDELDYDCIKGVCADGSCKIIGFNETGLCVTSNYFNQSFTQEQRAAITNYDSLFVNYVDVPSIFDCSWANTRNKPYCNALGQEFSNILFVRNLSYVQVDPSNYEFYYSGCSYLKNNMFGMYLESTSCSNQINIYHSNDFLYKTMAYGMTVSNNCIKNTPKSVNGLGLIYEGDCQSYSDDVLGNCVLSYIGYNGFYDCQTCDECKTYTMSGGDCSTFDPQNKCATADLSYCSKCTGPDNPCTLEQGLLCGLCQAYDECVKCTKYYPSSTTCKQCTQCKNIGNSLLSSCNNEYKVTSVDSLFSKYKSKMNLCVNHYPSIRSSNCIPYLECMNEINNDNICYNLAINSYWVKDNDKFSKQLYCYLDTLLYENKLSSDFITLSENVMYTTGTYDEKVKGTFMGFIDNCPNETPVECVDACATKAQTCILNCLKDINHIGDTEYCINMCTSSCIQNC